MTRSDLDGVSFLRVFGAEELKCYCGISLVSIIKGCPCTLYSVHTHKEKNKDIQGHSGTWVHSDICFEFLRLLVFLRQLLQSCIVVTISFLHFLFFKHLFDIRSWLLDLYHTSSTISFTFPFSWTSDPEMEPETKWSGSKEMMWKERAFMKSHIAQIQIQCTNTNAQIQIHDK